MEDASQKSLSSSVGNIPGEIVSKSFGEKLASDMAKITAASIGVWAGAGVASNVSPLLGAVVGIAGTATVALGSSVIHQDHANDRMRLEWGSDRSLGHSDAQKQEICDRVCRSSSKRMTLATLLTTTVLALTYPASNVGKSLLESNSQPTPTEQIDK